ncbi:unnamed protein product [Chondrus crispus]|uniref:BAR domain-containing protein n=1 Tax=Chondrus crispus TaxID=2769 RepID=R7QHJ4_CHOCR|nr:unnamed protein product [Chondrus crispus]CDF37524.1 unnamed protein product [Chondrus crispus]|eukprot:XP_005717395.1 unnamed protein product [Chondrus crispus]
MKRASTNMNVALQPKVAMAKRSFEQSIQQMGLKPGREVYQDDERLLDALLDLDELRTMLQSVASAVDQHRTRLLDVARSEAAIATILATPNDNLLALLRKQLSPARIDAQRGLGEAQMSASNAVARFALDMSTPMSDLSRTFDEAYNGKIVPLKKRYIAQKTEYLRYMRQAQAAEDLARKESLNSMAESAVPMWKATSDTLMAEIQSLVSYATSNMSEWTLNVAQAQSETFSRTARIFEEPARDAEKAQNLLPT